MSSHEEERYNGEEEEGSGFHGRCRERAREARPLREDEDRVLEMNKDEDNLRWMKWQRKKEE